MKLESILKGKSLREEVNKWIRKYHINNDIYSPLSNLEIKRVEEIKKKCSFNPTFFNFIKEYTNFKKALAVLTEGTYIGFKYGLIVSDGLDKYKNYEFLLTYFWGNGPETNKFAIHNKDSRKYGIIVVKCKDKNFGNHSIVKHHVPLFGGKDIKKFFKQVFDL